jgi:hypothetical protein
MPFWTTVDVLTLPTWGMVTSTCGRQSEGEQRRSAAPPSLRKVGCRKQEKRITTLESRPLYPSATRHVSSSDNPSRSAVPGAHQYHWQAERSRSYGLSIPSSRDWRTTLSFWLLNEIHVFSCSRRSEYRLCARPASTTTTHPDTTSETNSIRRGRAGLRLRLPRPKLPTNVAQKGPFNPLS